MKRRSYIEPIDYIMAIAVPVQTRERILQTAIAESFFKVSHEGQIAPLRVRRYITASKDQAGTRGILLREEKVIGVAVG